MKDLFSTHNIVAWLVVAGIAAAAGVAVGYVGGVKA